MRTLAKRLFSKGAPLLFALLRRILGRRRATAFDVYFGYRLLLGREPDPSGFVNHWRSTFGPGVEPAELAAVFMESEEFRARRRQVARARQDAYETLPVVEEVVELPGFRIAVDSNDAYIGRRILRDRAYQPAVAQAIRSLVGPGDLFVDVGANIGYFALLAAGRVGPAGAVLAIEPAPQNARLLERSVSLNGFRNVRVLRCAASDRNGTVRLRLFDRRNSGSFQLAPRGAPPGITLSVPCRTLDSIVGRRNPRLVKIDVEGAEGLVLRGMRGVLRRSRPFLLLEYTPSALRRLSRMGGETLLGELSATGYSFREAGPFDGRARPLTAAQIAARLADRGADHVDLLCCPVGAPPGR